MSRNLVVAFCPGARGFLLSRWLCKNIGANTYSHLFPNNLNSVEYNFSGNNHVFTPFYNDLLFLWKEKTKPVFNSIESELNSPDPSLAKLKNMLELSNHKPPDHLDGYSLIHTHHASSTGLQALSLALDAKLIRITLNNQEQGRQCYERKFGTPCSNLETLEQNYYPFIQNFDFSINVELNKVINLDLNFLKEML
jgi:hypothetical protein